jgi:hypothetical protein
MDKWLAVASALGGLTALGGLIDLAMYRSEKDRLKARLEDWWLRFSDVRWSNFGRREAELAVRILDRWAGPRLWSWQRWRFAADVTATVAILVLVWVGLRAVWSGGDVNLARTLEQPTTALSVVLFALSTLVAFALSLSVTRLVAAIVARVATTPFRSGLSFALLLAIHVLLLVYWSVFVYGLEGVSLLAVMRFLTMIGVKGFSFHGASFGQDILDVFRSLFAPDAGRDGIKLARPDWSMLFGLGAPDSPLGIVWVLAFKLAMDVVANGLRIVFALVFLSSFVFRPLVQEPLSRLWYGVMSSNRPIFTVLFGLVGTIVAALQAVTG